MSSHKDSSHMKSYRYKFLMSELGQSLLDDPNVSLRL
jgi:hypothetical protein